MAGDYKTCPRLQVLWVAYLLFHWILSPSLSTPLISEGIKRGGDHGIASISLSDINVRPHEVQVLW